MIQSKEERRAVTKRYHVTNRVMIAAKQKISYNLPRNIAKRNSPEGKARQKANSYRYRQSHPLQIQAATYAYNRLPHIAAKRVSMTANRRAKEYGAEGIITPEEWMDLQAAHEYKCVDCNEVVPRLTLDHVIPLSKGGANLISNCLPRCLMHNVKKGTKIYPTNMPATGFNSHKRIPGKKLLV